MDLEDRSIALTLDADGYLVRRNASGRHIWGLSRRVLEQYGKAKLLSADRRNRWLREPGTAASGSTYQPSLGAAFMSGDQRCLYQL
jgi:hypothetical protein